MLRRREAEAAAELKGFQLTHSLCGRLGGPVGVSIIRSLADEFPKKLRHLYSVASQQSALEDPLACSASVFALSNLHSTRLVDQVFVFENGAVQEMCSGAGTKAAGWLSR